MLLIPVTLVGSATCTGVVGTIVGIDGLEVRGDILLVRLSNGGEILLVRDGGEILLVLPANSLDFISKQSRLIMGLMGVGRAGRMAFGGVLNSVGLRARRVGFSGESVSLSVISRSFRT